MKFKLKKSDLNFKVYTVEAKPTVPGAENDIAVISPVPMTNWRMSPDKPSGIPRNDGDVWIQYSVSGNTFNALKQNTMMIATISTWQYVDGVWVKREAVSCHGGEWVNWITWLYDTGNQFSDVTGGWGKAWGGTSGNATLTLNSDKMTLYHSDANYLCVRTTKKVDLKKRSNVNLSFTAVSGSGNYWMISINIGCDNVAMANPDYVASATWSDKVVGTSKTISVPIPNDVENEYITIAMVGPATFDVHKVWID